MENHIVVAHCLDEQFEDVDLYFTGAGWLPNKSLAKPLTLEAANNVREAEAMRTAKEFGVYLDGDVQKIFEVIPA